MKKEHRIMNFSISILIVAVISLSIAFAAFSTNVNIRFGKVTQKAITFDIGFQEGTIEGEEHGTSETGRICGNALAIKDNVTVNSTTLSKPGDRCSYNLVVKNYGGMAARLATVTPRTPDGIACDFSEEAKMICGNITYKLTEDISGNNLISLNEKLGINKTKTIYLTVSYTGNNINNVSNTQSGAGFTLNYVNE